MGCYNCNAGQGEVGLLCGVASIISATRKKAAELCSVTAGASQEPNAVPAAAGEQQQQPTLPASPMPRQFYAKKIEDPGSILLWPGLSVLVAVSDRPAVTCPCSLTHAATSRLIFASATYMCGAHVFEALIYSQYGVDCCEIWVQGWCQRCWLPEWSLGLCVRQ